MALTRKQREVAQRDQLIRDTARQMLLGEGYHALNMDRIAEAIEYSKGTVYQHYSSKEDLIAALAVETCAKRTAMFQRAVGFRGRPRERIAAVGVADRLFVDLYPEHFKVEHLMDMDTVFDKASPDKLEKMHQIKDRMMDALEGVVRDAVEAGDLALPEGAPHCQVLYGLWSLSVGHHMIRTAPHRTEHFIKQSDGEALWGNYNVLLDGYQWKPLSGEWDYRQTVQRILEEVFWDEHQRLSEPAGA